MAYHGIGLYTVYRINMLSICLISENNIGSTMPEFLK